MEVTLRPYSGEEAAAVKLIQDFWRMHNGCDPSESDAREDLACWTRKGHHFAFICADGAMVGFVHLGSRGAAIDWLEDIFVLPNHQNQGIGTQAIRLVEAQVMRYSDSLYIEAAARNERAIRLYRKLGYDCLNTITVRKDFPQGKYKHVRTETIYSLPFEIRKE